MDAAAPPRPPPEESPSPAVLGIDVGEKHMGVCLLRPGRAADGSQDAIEHWEVREIASESARSVARSLEPLASMARDLAARDEGVTAVIERQPPKNQKMRRLQHYVEMAMTLADDRVEVVVQDPGHKLQYAATTPAWPSEPPASWTYAARKKLAVQTATAMVAGREEWAARLAASRKKDDMADALLHAMAFAHHLAPLHRAKQGLPPPKLVARKPSAKALASGNFGRSALKYMVLHGHEKCGSAGFARSARKHFGSTEALREACGLPAGR